MKWGCTVMTVSYFCVQSDPKSHRKKETIEQGIQIQWFKVSQKVALKANRKIVHFLDMTLFNSDKW